MSSTNPRLPIDQQGELYKKTAYLHTLGNNFSTGLALYFQTRLVCSLHRSCRQVALPTPMLICLSGSILITIPLFAFLR
jgi:hypothetical protein